VTLEANLNAIIHNVSLSQGIRQKYVIIACNVQLLTYLIT